MPGSIPARPSANLERKAKIMNAHNIFTEGNSKPLPTNGAGESVTRQDVQHVEASIARHSDIHRRVIESCQQAIRVIGCNSDMAVRGYEADLQEAQSAFDRERERLTRLIDTTRAETADKLGEQKRLLAASESALAVLNAPVPAMRKSRAA